MRFQQRSCGSIEKLRPLQTSAFAVNQRAFGVVMIIGSLLFTHGQSAGRSGRLSDDGLSSSLRDENDPHWRCPMTTHDSRDDRESNGIRQAVLLTAVLIVLAGCLVVSHLGWRKIIVLL